MKLYALMVTHNEERYFLSDVVHWLSGIVDQVLVFDDASSDGTRRVAEAAGAWVVPRPYDTPSFMQHEGAFRSASLQAFEGVLQAGDWILINDADEYLVPVTGGQEEARLALKQLILMARQRHLLGVRIPIHTVWSVQRHADVMASPLIRKQSTGTFTWDLNEPRLWRWQPGACFQDLAMGCRNQPTYVNGYELVMATQPVAFLHYGYATDEWQKRKYLRYSQLANHGHNNDFIESIVEPDPPLILWDGVDPLPTLGHRSPL